MSASLNLHSADSNSAKVTDFSKDKDSVQFTSVSVFDYEKNAEVILYFPNPAEVINFAILLQLQAKKALKN